MSDIQIIQFRGVYYHVPKLPEIEHLAEEQISQIKWLLIESLHSHLATSRSSSSNPSLIIKWQDLKKETRERLMSSVYKMVFAVAPGCQTHKRRHYVETV
jgi:hypothetical protein